MVKKRNIISFEVSDETASLWGAVKNNPKAQRGFQTGILRRLLENFLGDFGNWENLMCLDDDLRCKFERYQTYNIEHKGRMLQIETQKRIYWNAMENAFMLTNMPILYVKFGFELMEDFIDMIRSGVFEQTEGTLSVPRDLVKEFILDTFEALEASGEMNRLRCEEQIKDYEGELPTAKVN